MLAGFYLTLLLPMTHLAAALADLASPAGRLAAARAVTDHVFGPYVAGQPFVPRPYAENKGRWGRVDE